ncbi:SdpA family antimicrobial peptide system protein [Bacillus sp. REN10]|uniref:SdpA family antimicrobial peptide system protein n=1 Tax=Bacillus sp. REN10 TaxID=2782541 RepID=UPI00193C27E0|nr:SdpA family antimicrobial peptide system protein [Bacillus sp. REN10]
MNHQKIKIFMVSFFFCSFSVYYYANLAPQNKLLKKNIIQELAPQGFGFYSKSPRAPATTITAKDGSIRLPNGSPKNLFGLRRYGRVQGVELGKLSAEIPRDSWVKCTTNTECEKKIERIKTIKIKKTKNYEHLNKGEYIFEVQEPLSWYFLKYKDTTSFDKKMVKVVLK